MGRPIEIYTLTDPRNGHIKYVGKANDSKKRLTSHLRDSKSRNTPVYIWIKELKQIGLIPELNIIAFCDDDNWQEVERRAIIEYRNNGHVLLNVAAGGNEPFCSTKQRAINGRQTAKNIHSNYKKKRLWKLKHSLALTLKFLIEVGRESKVNEIRAKLIKNGISI